MPEEPYNPSPIGNATGCMVRPASGCSSRWLIEPIHLETFAQRHTRSMQHDPQIAIGDRQNRANLLARHIVHFTHCENITYFLWQFRETITHRLPELGA